MDTAKDESQAYRSSSQNMPTQDQGQNWEKLTGEENLGRREILLVDDGSPNFERIAYVLQFKGYQVTMAPNAEVALDALDDHAFELVITRLTRRQTAGLAVIKKAKRLRPRTASIILASRHDMDLPVEAYSLEVDDYLLLPCSAVEMCRRVAACLGRSLEGKEQKSRAAVVNERVLDTLRMVFHDLRSSLVSMSASLNLMHRGKFGKMDEGVAHKIRELSSRVTGMIGMTEDFLGKTFLAESDFHIEPEDLDLRRDIINQVLKELFGELNEKRVVIHNRFKANGGDRIPIKGNRFWLKSVFRNLLHNAIKYGGKGGTIEIALEDRDSCWRLNVYNSGRPISSEDRRKLFAKFNRAGNEHKRERAGGLGLGLYLIQDILKKHGGDIWYEAKEHGSNFVVTLPRC
jgi:signal transduction histidine kinase